MRISFTLRTWFIVALIVLQLLQSWKISVLTEKCDRAKRLEIYMHLLSYGLRDNTEADRKRFDEIQKHLKDKP